MVFESLVADLMNKYLGDYMENLDKSQLKLGIWGGDVVLENLDLKENALDDLNLPIRVKSGHLGKLVLKIPWKNLYKAPVVAYLEGLYILAVPNAGVEYDEEKDRKFKLEAKQKELRRIEEAKEKAKEKDVPQKEKADSFAEKLGLQVVKNLQIEIKNIHVRYEDEVSSPSNPFSVGVTLKNLSFQTCDENWKPSILDLSVKMIYKLVQLDKLALYWNTKGGQMFSTQPKDMLRNLLKSTIEAGSESTRNFRYVINPISATLQAKINFKPESNLSIPKIFASMILEEISVHVSKNQYGNVLLMLESFERMQRNEQYRKYKPLQPLRNNSRLWWNYAINAILEESVRRRLEQWSWTHIKEHRIKGRRYKEAYKQKLVSKKLPSEILKSIEFLEEELDVFNITLLRQQAQVEARKAGVKKEKKAKKSGSVFSGWFGGKKKKNEKEEKENEEKDVLSEAMTPEEKEKMYAAIGYSESVSDPTFPVEYVGLELNFWLKKTSVQLLDETLKYPEIITAQLSHLKAKLTQRPAADAIGLESEIGEFSVFGMMSEGRKRPPQMVKSKTSSEEVKRQTLVDLQLETNPLDGNCDQRVSLGSRPLQIVYDANTVNQIVEFFRFPEQVHLKDLQEATWSKFEELSGQTTTGLQHVLDTRTILEVKVDVMGSQVIVPENGSYQESASNILLLNLGDFKVQSKNPGKLTEARKQTESFEELAEMSYDKFEINLESIQILFASAGENWEKALRADQSPMHILQPMMVGVVLEKSIVTNDSRMPLIKVSGSLPSLVLDVSDQRVQQVVHLFQSIPFPQPPKATPSLAAPPSTVYSDQHERNLVSAVMELESEGDEDEEEEFVLAADSEEMIREQITKLDLKFTVDKVVLNLSQVTKNNLSLPILQLIVSSMKANVRMRKWDLNVAASLETISMEHMQYRAVSGEALYLVDTRTEEAGDDSLFSMNFLKADRESPEFGSTYKSTEQLLTINFSSLAVTAHSAAILNVVNLVQALVPQLESAATAKSGGGTTRGSPEDEVYSSGTDRRKSADAFPLRRPKPSAITQLKLDANLKNIALSICTDTTNLSDIVIHGLEANVIVKADRTVVDAYLKDIVIRDNYEGTLYPEILSVEGANNVFEAHVIAYNNATVGDYYTDMEAVDTEVHLDIGRISVVFINRFVMDILGFVNNFQAAKQALVDASATAAESALQKVQEVSVRSARVALEVRVQAPFVKVPRGSKFTGALVLDLGVLTVGNVFYLRETHNSAPVVMEKMNVELSSMQMYRAEIVESRVKSQVLLIQPITLSIELNRNLASSWYHGVPEIDVSGKIPALSASISQDDFAAIIAILQDNLGEAASSQTSGVADQNHEQALMAQTASTVESGKGEDTEAKPTAEVWTRVKFGFELKTVSAALYTSRTDLPNLEGLQTRNEKGCLGKFEIRELVVHGNVKSDTSLDTALSLFTIILDDRRPGRESGITRMFDHSLRSPPAGSENGDGDKPVPIIAVTFTQHSNSDKHVGVKVHNLYLCMSMEYLMTLADFFTKGLPQPGPPAATAVVPRQQPGAAAASQQPAPPRPLTLSLRLTVEDPEIIMVADNMDVNTNALVLQTSVEFRLYIVGEDQTMSGSVSNLQIIHCPFSLEDKTKGLKVLAPCTVGLHLKSAQDSGQHIDVSLPEVNLNISPMIIRTIAAIAEKMKPPDREEDKETGQLKKVPADLWSIKDVNQCDFWFIKQDVGELEDSPDDYSPDSGEGGGGGLKIRRSEELVVRIDRVAIRLEASVGRRTVPMLVLESSMEAQVKDWSSKLGVSSSLELEVSYYNERIAEWEPLLETVELQGGQRRPWQLSMEVAKTEEDYDPASYEEDSVDSKTFIPSPPPDMSINIKSEDNMELTMTKTCVDVLTNLYKAFKKAVEEPSRSLQDEGTVPPYLVINSTGLEVVINPGPLFKDAEGIVEGKARLATGQSLSLHPEIQALESKKLPAQVPGLRKEICVQVDGFKDLRQIDINRAGSILYNLQVAEGYPHITYSLVVHVDSTLGSKTITLRSPLQVKNHFPIDIDLFVFNEKKVMEPIGTIGPGQMTPIALKPAYKADIYVQPAAETGYKVSNSAMSWQSLWNNKKEGKVNQIFKCGSNEPGVAAFCFTVYPEMDKFIYVDGSSTRAPKFILHVHPTVVFHNLLTLPVYCYLPDTPDEIIIEPGNHKALLTAEIGKSMMEVVLKNYRGREWRGKMTLRYGLRELSSWAFEAYGSQGKKSSVDFAVYADYTNGIKDVTLYSPYWMVNKTGLDLAYKGSDEKGVFDHPADFTKAVMFSFSSKQFFGKKKASLMVKGSSGNSSWSGSFSLDTVASSGSITCNSQDRNYEIGVQISLSSLRLTKIVVFTPMYMLLNYTDYPVLCTQESTSDDYSVAPEECKPFWPAKTTSSSKKEAVVARLRVRKQGSQGFSAPFTFAKPQIFLLESTDESVGGIEVDVQVSEAATVIAFHGYHAGAAAVQIINHSSHASFQFHQSGTDRMVVVSPMMSQLYTWDDPAGQKEVTWFVGKISHKDKLLRDGFVEFKLEGDSERTFFISFLHGSQRVFLLTQDLPTVNRARQAVELEQPDQEITLSLQGIGISLVNNLTRHELAYLGITSSGIVWETKKRKRWQPLNGKQNEILEQAFQHYEMVQSSGGALPTQPQTVENVEFNLDSMRLLKPHHRPLRRSFQSGVWAQFRSFRHQLQLHCKFNYLQVDNQLPASVFPTVLAPIPPPQSVAAENAPKPFAEFSALMRLSEHAVTKQVKYCKLLVQEMHFKLDQGFLNAVVLYFTSDSTVDIEESVFFQEDLDFLKLSLAESEAVQGAKNEERNYYDLFHLSPLKIHVSFSLHSSGSDEEKGGQARGGSSRVGGQAVELLLQSVGVTLTDIQDVVFKLGCFERKYKFYSPIQLMFEARKHYTSQAVKQLYVLVLGLDVLGNPYGLVKGLTEGVTDLFYEPYQGAVQGPEEFAEGLALGMRSLLGHAVGGVSGAVSRITGTLGKGLAALTMDEDYQKKRLQQMNKPTDLKEGLARGGKGLVMGVVEGVSGIVTQPVKGARKEGAAGFFKGVGKGLVGVVARPAGGVIDAASSAFDGIRRVSEMGSEVRRLRPPRLIHSDGVVRPFAQRESQGNEILMLMSKAMFATSDNYVAHMTTTKDRKHVLLVTDRRVAYAVKGNIFGHWDCVWQHQYQDLKEPPVVTDKGIRILLKEQRVQVEEQKKKKNPFAKISSVFQPAGVHNSKVVSVTNPKAAQWLVSKIHESMAKFLRVS